MISKTRRIRNKYCSRRKRYNIYYCEPNRSDKKAKVEKNHEYIRYIIPNGTSMDNYQQIDIDVIMNHINSTAREILNFATLYDMASVYLSIYIVKILKYVKYNLIILY